MYKKYIYILKTNLKSKSEFEFRFEKLHYRIRTKFEIYEFGKPEFDSDFRFTDFENSEFNSNSVGKSEFFDFAHPYLSVLCSLDGETRRKKSTLSPSLSRLSLGSQRQAKTRLHLSSSPPSSHSALSQGQATTRKKTSLSIPSIGPVFFFPRKTSRFPPQLQTKLSALS